MYKKTIAVIKFIYLYLAYWLVGLSEEYFYIYKGNYLADLEKYSSAIKAYKKAQKEDELYSVYAAIGWCYANLENNELALENYRKAYEKIRRHDISIALAHLEMEHGEINQCREVFESLKEDRSDLPSDSQKLYDKIQEFLSNSEMTNSSL